ncbi:MAG: hypothetical protein HOJ35_08815 [Bdellovibrionales bacterium]|jgi:hypothetical protein|nr:hypothetical protein [Bdellovibrionales bacterium]
MAKKRKRTYNYKCTISSESFKTTKEAEHPDELVSVRAFYEMYPEEDDRPEVVKKRASLEEQSFDEEDEENKED